ncbi:metal-dependent hydrolase [Thalassolituus sp.]|jgi:predicted metal-dependent hydrolase|uniref:metal-dependent hydrolase n=1 Tax=Thalassolituus sp. TaxID=2030822 RepID=UPI00262ED90A|nr:metal-dependent hydrolase [uncultured Thalassolituus sp.]TNC92084.1 MAG: metal-dependent hydrolase [Thalassolituus sp.]
MTDIKNKSQSVEIKPRRMAFDTSAPMQKFAFENNSLISTFFYALSALFPDGERFFIHSVRNYRDDIKDDILKEQIRGFIGQEAHHGVSHEALNKAIENMGFPMERIVGRLHKRVAFLKSLSRERQLAMTVAMEHFTASLAEFLLKNPEILDGAAPVVRKMLLWHAVEEIEHKAVAFDVYREHVNDEFMRKRVMVFAMISLFSRLAMYQVWLLRSQRHFPSWREWKEAAVFFWGKKGVLRDNMKGLAKFFRTGFHPWDIDQNYLIEDWEKRYPDIAELQVN